MARLNAQERGDFPDSRFALPDRRKYPLNDREHDINAKGRATQEEDSGKLSPSDDAKIQRRADAALKRVRSRGRRKS